MKNMCQNIDILRFLRVAIWDGVENKILNKIKIRKLHDLGHVMKGEK